MVAMTDNEAGRTAPDAEMASAMIDQIFDLWILPEISIRGLGLTREQVNKALVVMAPGLAPKVEINEEAQLSVRMPAPGPVSRGQTVPIDVEKVQFLRPVRVDPDASWIAFARLNETDIVAFDFRRNRARALALLERAEAYLRTARNALAAKDEYPAVENGWAAAELGTMAQMHLMEDSLEEDHKARTRWLDAWTKLQNAPRTHYKVLARFMQLRPWSRYGDTTFAPRPGEVRRLLNDVEDLLAEARRFVGEPLPDLEPLTPGEHATQTSEPKET
jgi:hypothetical protein